MKTGFLGIVSLDEPSFASGLSVGVGTMDEASEMTEGIDGFDGFETDIDAAEPKSEELDTMIGRCWVAVGLDASMDASGAPISSMEILRDCGCRSMSSGLSGHIISSIELRGR